MARGARDGRGWGARLAALALAVLAAGPTSAEAVKIGLLKTTGSGALYLALDRGYFTAAGLSVELVHFDSAQPIAVALAAGDIDFGSTGFTAGFFGLASQGTMRIVAGTTREVPGIDFQPFLASNRAHAAGLTSFKNFPGHSFALSQIGSPTHYALGLIADKYGFDIKTLRLLPLQSIPNTISAIIGGQADLTMMPGNFAVPLLRGAEATLIGYVGNETPYQLAGVMVTSQTADTRGDMIRRLLRALRKGARDYYDAFIGKDGKRADGPTTPAVLAIIAKHTGQSVETVAASVAYVDPELRLDVKDTLHQLAWYRAQGMVRGPVGGDTIIDRRYVVALPGG